jgi:hypothetical protein
VKSQRDVVQVSLMMVTVSALYSHRSMHYSRKISQQPRHQMLCSYVDSLGWLCLMKNNCTALRDALTIVHRPRSKKWSRA